MIFPLLVGAGAFALGGVGPAVLGLVIAGGAVVIAVRMDRTPPAGDQTNAQASPALVERFRRLWLMSVVAAVLGTALIYVGAGTEAGTVALVFAVLFVASGAVALVVMRKRGGA
jgi:hypothetical protein